MARERQFNPTDALDKAMHVFWRQGYAETSIDDLVRATGVNRYSLYDEFASKQGLFLAALDHYQETIASMLLGPLEQPGASLAQIRTYFETLLRLSSTEMGRLGCLMVNSASAVAPCDKRTAKKVNAFRTRMKLAFNNSLTNATAKAELGPAVDADKAADFLVGVCQGLSVMARSHADPRILANVAEVTLAALK